MSETDEVESAKEAMIRWQGYARESRTAVNSHFLTYAAAILAFQISILISKDMDSISSPCIFILGGFMAMCSLITGSVIVLIRLRDARLTARTARYRFTNRSQQDIDNLRAATNFLGMWTNKLIPWQVLLFSVSALLLGVWVVITNCAKLYG